ncbi:hypothetical protein PVK06_035170 [Gossypium arboreum]|uniref:Uncharacterized protein n=1 Tax=Gossypium arboreum TaxID=29729 RepID=A0ABR0NH28_GOSAR|nr:hypothetical protein PVK06_035170 [Gossypium arboreum]
MENDDEDSLLATMDGKKKPRFNTMDSIISMGIDLLETNDERVEALIQQILTATCKQADRML